MAIAIIWLLIILFLTIIPAEGPQVDLPLDKMVHFVMYGITAIVFFRVLRPKKSLTLTIILSIGLASFYGFAMEVLQLALPWRQFSFSDEVANIGGALFFGVIYGMKDYYCKG